MRAAVKRVLLIVTGGIAAYKTPDLVRKLKERGMAVRCVLTRGGAQFVTPLALGAVSGGKVRQEIFDLTDEAEMGHIQLSRDADVLLVAPATADILARMANGLASGLAAAALLATDKPVIAAPAMNVRMWEHPATQANIATLKARGIIFLGPDDGDMACGEYGPGRMAEPAEIAAAVKSFLDGNGKLNGRRAVVTSGPTHEPIDPVRHIANRSSGKQGHAIAGALAKLGAETVLISGPTHLPDPAGVTTVRVESARDMLAACEDALPADIAVCAAAVADWRVANAADQKIKKEAGGPPALVMAENPDILKTLSQAGNKRPSLVVGFAAETENVIEHAASKRARKGCDWIVANDVSPAAGVFGGDANTVHLISEAGVENWPRMSKADVARRLANRVAGHFGADGAA